MPPLACAPHIARAGDTKISGHIFTNTAMECNARTTTPPGPRGNKTPFLILTKAGGEPIGLGLPVNCSPVSTPGLCSCWTWTWNLEFLKETARKVMTRAPPDGETPKFYTAAQAPPSSVRRAGADVVSPPPVKPVAWGVRPSPCGRWPCARGSKESRGGTAPDAAQ